MLPEYCVENSNGVHAWRVITSEGLGRKNAAGSPKTKNVVSESRLHEYLCSAHKSIINTEDDPTTVCVSWTSKFTSNNVQIFQMCPKHPTAKACSHHLHHLWVFSVFIHKSHVLIKHVKYHQHLNSEPPQPIEVLPSLMRVSTFSSVFLRASTRARWEVSDLQSKSYILWLKSLITSCPVSLAVG